jgi:hypothetical protein
MKGRSESMHSTHRKIAIVFGTAAFAALSGACSTDDGKPSSSSSSSGSPAQDASTGGSDAGGDATTSGKKKNAEVGCTKNEDCESNICFMGGNQSYCALKCDSTNAATICAAPFTGSCNNKGYCKRD